MFTSTRAYREYFTVPPTRLLACLYPATGMYWRRSTTRLLLRTGARYYLHFSSRLLRLLHLGVRGSGMSYVHIYYIVRVLLITDFLCACSISWQGLEAKYHSTSSDATSRLLEQASWAYRTHPASPEMTAAFYTAGFTRAPCRVPVASPPLPPLLFYVICFPQPSK